MSTGLLEKEPWQGDNGTVLLSEPEAPARQKGKSNKLVGRWFAKAEPDFADPAPLFSHLSFPLHVPKSKCEVEEGVGGGMGMWKDSGKSERG